MIAEVPQPVSSVVALAHRVCEAHGATLFEVRSSIHTFGEKRTAVWVARRQRIVYAMRHAKPMRPSFPEIAQALGMPNHSTAITAYQREVKRRDMERHMEMVEIGKAVASGLEWHEEAREEAVDKSSPDPRK